MFSCPDSHKYVTDILTFQADYCVQIIVIGLEFFGQKVCFFLIIPRRPRTNKHYYHTEMTEQLNPRKSYRLRLNVALATRNTFVGQMWLAGRVFVTPGLKNDVAMLNFCLINLEHK